MPKLTHLEEVKAALKTAAREVGPRTTSRAAAAKLLADDPEVFRPVEKDWILEKAANVIAKYRLERRREKDPQYRLGFGHMPRRIKLRSGDVVRRADATIADLRQLATQLRRSRHPALDEVEKAITLMAKYTARGEGQKHGISWSEVLDLEAKIKE